MRRIWTTFLTSAVLAFSVAPCWAQDGIPAAPEAAPAPAAAPAAAATPAPTDAPPPVAVVKDGPRYRWGVAASFGIETVLPDTGDSLSAPMGGLDVRLGMQLNDLLGFYVQSYLGAGKFDVGGSVNSLVGWTGTFAFSAMAEATFLERFFAGGGLGYGVLNNPSGVMLHARAGFYPLMSRIENSVRRRGLMVGVDIRSVFIDGGTGVLVMAAIGYEKF